VPRIIALLKIHCGKAQAIVLINFDNVEHEMEVSIANISEQPHTIICKNKSASKNCAVFVESK
jgi:hypothetical protein